MAYTLSSFPPVADQRLSWQDLVRQKFILDIVQRVQQPLQQDDLIQLDQGLIMDTDRYRGGIDADMQRVIDLDRQRRLLDEHQIFSIRNMEHVQQLRGIYRLLVRANEFETLQRNVIYLRRNINPVMLINALTLAIRDREDSQALIVPAVQEILPELYLDQQTIQQVQRTQQELEQSQRSSFMNLVGLRQRMREANPMMRITMPWRELGLQMALGRQKLRQGQTVVVQPVQSNVDNDISLLTEDIGMRNFVQNLIQELALLEESENVRRVGSYADEVEEDSYQQDQDVYGNQRERFLDTLRSRNGGDGYVQDRNQEDRYVRVPLQRNIGGGIDRVSGYRRYSDDQVGQLPTVSTDNERLVHVGRRRQYDISNGSEEDQLLAQYRGMIRGERLSEGRRVEEEPIDRRGPYQRSQNIYNPYQQQENVDDEQKNYYGRSSGNLPTVRRDDERLVYINKRRLNQNQEDLTPRRVFPIEEGRRVGDMKDEDIVQLIRRDNRLEQLSDDEILEMLRRNRQRKEQEQEQERFQGVVRGDRFSEGRRVEQQQDQDEDQDRRQNEDRLIQLIRQDSRLGQLSNGEIIDILRQYRQQLEREQNNGGRRTRRSLVSPIVKQTFLRRSEIVLQTFRQLLARLNQERIAVRLNEDELQLIDNSRQILPNENQGQRYALRLNEMRQDSRRNRALIEQINLVEGRLQQVIGQLVRERTSQQGQIDVERAIGDVLLGRIGNIGIIRILRQQLQHSSLVQQQDRLGLGVNLSDRVLQYTLQRILSIVDEQREQLFGVYRREQLEMPDVNINDVRVSPLRTRIEDFDLDVSNLLEQPQQSEQVQQQRQALVRQRRLNNAPFTIDLDINSERAQEAIVRIFLGPRQDAAGRELSLEQRRTDFVLLDAIKVELQSGRNRIQQRSTNFDWTTRDATPYSEIYRRVMTSVRGQQQKQQEQNSINDLVGENGRFPQRLLLPRGRREGLPMQLLVIVSPVLQQQQESVRLERFDGVMGISQASIEDNRPLGYPLDRRLDNEQQLLRFSNVQIQDVVIVQEN